MSEKLPFYKTNPITFHVIKSLENYRAQNIISLLDLCNPDDNIQLEKEIFYRLYQQGDDYSDVKNMMEDYAPAILKEAMVKPLIEMTEKLIPTIINDKELLDQIENLYLSIEASYDGYEEFSFVVGNEVFYISDRSDLLNALFDGIENISDKFDKDFAEQAILAMPKQEIDTSIELNLITHYLPNLPDNEGIPLSNYSIADQNSQLLYHLAKLYENPDNNISQEVLRFCNNELTNALVSLENFSKIFPQIADQVKMLQGMEINENGLKLQNGQQFRSFDDVLKVIQEQQSPEFTENRYGMKP